MKIKSGSKRCGQCGRVKKLTSFPQLKARKDGRRPQCRDCHSLNNAVSGAHRRALEYGVTSTLTVQEWTRIRAQYDGRCAMCSRKTKLTLDHAVALACGGTNTAGNVQPLCLKCNLGKGTTEIIIGPNGHPPFMFAKLDRDDRQEELNAA